MPIIYYLGILRNEPRPAVELAIARDSSSFSRFTKGNYEQFMTMFAKTVAERTKPGERAVVQEQQYKFHAFAKTNSLCAIAITEDAYADMDAQDILNQIMDDFEKVHTYNSYSNPATTSLPLPSLQTNVIKFQDPTKVNKISEIRNDLNNTKEILHKTIESLLERGEKIDTLVQKSDDLSAQSKMFYTSAKKQNSCCVVM